MSRESFAHIERIGEFHSIPKKDRIQTARVLGWNVIVRKDEFKDNDWCIYIEIDSQLPAIEPFAFLENKRYRIRTLKMAGTVSQGMALPIAKYEEITGKPLPEKYLISGYDVTKDLGIARYEPKITKDGTQKSPTGVQRMRKFPRKYAVITDETNIQNIPTLITRNIGRMFYVTEKLEGQSATYIYRKSRIPILKWFGIGDKFIVASHKRELVREDTSSFWTVAKEQGIKEKMKEYCYEYDCSLTIQGEIIGKGIQKNIYNIDGYDFYVFNTVDSRSRQKYGFIQTALILGILGLKYVPFVRQYEMTEDITVDSLLADADGRSILYDTPREGYVHRTDDMKTSFKVRSPKYLLGES